MSLLEKKSKRLNYRLVGASMPPQVHIYLSLYTTAKGIAKTDIVGSLLTTWVEERKKEYSEEELKALLLDRIQKKWNSLKAGKATESFPDFKIRVTEELVGKGLQDNCIVEILDKIKQYETVKRDRTA